MTSTSPLVRQSSGTRRTRFAAILLLAGILPIPSALAATPAFVQEAYIKPSDTTSNAAFGSAMAMSGNTLVVGVKTTNSAAGTANVFTRDASTGAWVQQAVLSAANAEAGDHFGAAVAIDGDTIVVGAPSESSAATGVNSNGNDNTAAGAGAAYVFTRTGTAWSQQAYLKASNTDAGDSFGSAVAVGRDSVLVGAPDEDSNTTTQINGDQTNNTATDAGAAYDFTRSGTAWSQKGYLKAMNTDAGDYFGASVAGYYSTGTQFFEMLVGAPDEDSNAKNVSTDNAPNPWADNSAPGSGAAYFFEDKNGLVAQYYYKASNTEAGDAFGAAVAVAPNALIIGAPNEDSNATGIDGDGTNNSAVDSGAVYIYTFTTVTILGQPNYIKASNTEAGDHFGGSLAASGVPDAARSTSVAADTLVVGAPQEDSNAVGLDGDQANNAVVDSGAAYLFTFTASSSTNRAMTQQHYLKAINAEAGDSFGAAVAIAADGTAVVGAPDEDSNATGINGDRTNNTAPAAGAVYGFANDSITSVVPANGVYGTPYTHTYTTNQTPTDTYSVASGALPPGLTLNTATGALSGTPMQAGSYAFTVAATNTIGAVVSQAATVLIAKAPLIVTAQNQQTQRGMALPPLTLAYSGLVLGDTASSLDTAPTASTTATQNSPIGTYSIVASGGADANYEISYVQGTLTIHPVTLYMPLIKATDSKLYKPLIEAADQRL